MIKELNRFQIGLLSGMISFPKYREEFLNKAEEAADILYIDGDIEKMKADTVVVYNHVKESALVKMLRASSKQFVKWDGGSLDVMSTVVEANSSVLEEMEPFLLNKSKKHHGDHEQFKLLATLCLMKDEDIVKLYRNEASHMKMAREVMNRALEVLKVVRKSVTYIAITAYLSLHGPTGVSSLAEITDVVTDVLKELLPAIKHNIEGDNEPMAFDVSLN